MTLNLKSKVKAEIGVISRNIIISDRETTLDHNIPVPGITAIDKRLEGFPSKFSK